MRRFGERGIAAVADGDHYIAQEAVAADPLDRRLAEQGAECGAVQCRQHGQWRRLQFLARPKLDLGCMAREFVPGAYRQAIVTAKYAVAHRLAEFTRDRALVLDGQIGNAA